MFSCLGANIFLNSVILIEHNSRGNLGTKLGYFGFAVVLIAILHATFSLLKVFGPVWQKIAVTSFIIWYIVFFYMLVRENPTVLKDNKNLPHNSMKVKNSI